MARLIDAEKMLTDALENKRFVFQTEDLLNRQVVFETVYGDLAEFIYSQPVVDAVEVVRCENCKFWIDKIYKDPTLGYCEICDRCTDNDDFCSTGIKRDGGE